MRHRYLTLLGVMAFAVAILTLATISTVGQTPARGARGQAAPATTTPPRGQTATPAPATTGASARPGLPKPGPAPRTPWGTPDLQGAWFVMEQVPLQRSAANANKPLLTDQEVAALDARNAESIGRNARAAAGTDQDVSGAYNAVFNSVLRTSKRTSMIIDPPDGRIPTADGGGRGGGGGGGGAGRGGGGGGAGGGQAPAAGAAGGAGRGAGAGAPAGGQAPAAAAGGGGRGGGRGGGNQNDNPETVAQNARCLGVATPFLPLNTAFAQGTVMEIVQSPKSMAIYMEDDHAGGSNRIIYIDNRPHLPSNIRTFLGDSRAHWEGNALVVETTNFTAGFQGASAENFKMTERFTRVDSNNLRREITFSEVTPQAWTRPWTVLIELGKTSDNKHMIFESACHEGNYGLTGILVGARKEEQAAR